MLISSSEEHRGNAPFILAQPGTLSSTSSRPRNSPHASSATSSHSRSPQLMYPDDTESSHGNDYGNEVGGDGKEDPGPALGAKRRRSTSPHVGSNSSHSGVAKRRKSGSLERMTTDIPDQELHVGPTGGLASLGDILASEGGPTFSYAEGSRELLHRNTTFPGAEGSSTTKDTTTDEVKGRQPLVSDAESTRVSVALTSDKACANEDDPGVAYNRMMDEFLSKSPLSTGGAAPRGHSLTKLDAGTQFLHNTAGASASSPDSLVSSSKSKGKGKAQQTTPESVPIDAVEPLAAYTCPICFSPPSYATVTPCGHVLCGECLFTAVKTTMQRAAYTLPHNERMVARCPVCRAPIPGWDGKGGGVIGLKPRAVFSL